MTIPIHSLELVDLSESSVDLTPAESFVTLPASAGQYPVGLRVINEAGSMVIAEPTMIDIAISSSLPDGDRFVAIGNLNAAEPYDTWQTAAAGIQAAVNQANPGDVIRVARGIYHGEGNQIVTITHSLQLSGIHPREEVVINGGGGRFGSRKGVQISFPAAEETSPHVVLENITIRDCIETGTQYGNSGVGIQILSANVTEGSVTIKNCVVSKNQCIKGSNGDRNRGTGIYAAGTSGTALHIRIIDCLIKDNMSVGSTGNGAGLYMTHGRLTLERSDFIGNSAGGLKRQGSSISPASGGGAILFNMAAGSVIRHCRFMDNASKQGGGGSYGGGLYVGTLPVTIENSTFSGNIAGYAGGIYLNTSGYTNLVRNCLVHDNAALAWGGGVASVDRTVIESSTIMNNSCTSVSGGGGGVQGSFFLFNSIIRDNTPNNGNHYGTGTRYYEYCCTKPVKDTAGNYYTVGNFDADPLFVDASSGNFRLTAASPCRDKGTNMPWMVTARDLDGRPRRDAGAGRVDIGCYEYQTLGAILLLR